MLFILVSLHGHFFQGAIYDFVDVLVLPFSMVTTYVIAGISEPFDRRSFWLE